MSDWLLDHNGKTVGPITSKQLKQLAEAGKINPESKVKKTGSENWSPASKVRGLFDPQPIHGQLITTPVMPVTAIQRMVDCPFCAEPINANAIKCKHCGEYLDGRQTQQPVQQPQAAAPAAPVHVHVTQNAATQTVVMMHPQKRYSRGVAALLSLLVPGLGQLYKGQPINGLVWFCLTIAGYVAFVIPGLVLHFFCVLGALSGNNN